MEFEHKISKGSRFNQIYIPKEMESIFEVGDIVKVKLLKKKTEIYYSKNLLKLEEFKEKLIKEIFSHLSTYPNIKQIFIVGSFLIEKVDYNDIDLVIIANKKQEDLEKKIYNYFIKKFPLKIHIIVIQEDSFLYLLRICPLTRSMFYYYISNKNFDLPLNTTINKNHINFLLMMPEDLLKITANSRSFYDTIRRLITIKQFLENKDLNPIKINAKLKSLFGGFLYSQIKNNEPIDKEILKYLRSIIRINLEEIQKKYN